MNDGHQLPFLTCKLPIKLFAPVQVARVAFQYANFYVAKVKRK